MNNPAARRNAIDPVVADLLNLAERKKKLASLPRAERNRARKDAARHKVGLDLSPDLHHRLREIAQQEQVSISSLVALFCEMGLQAYHAGQIPLDEYKRLSRCARFEYVLVSEKIKLPEEVR